MNLIGNINAIPFRRRFGGGGGTPFPYIPGMIARWSAKGLTNEDMSTNPVWKDLTGNGYDLQMKNFAWAGMSGCDGYTESFSKIIVNYQSEINSNTKITITGGRATAVNIRYNGNTFNSYIKVTGLNTISNETNGLLIYNSLSSSVKGFKCNTDGIYKVEIEDIPNSQIYIWLQSKTAQITYSNPITVEILPLYPGALVFDGIDDYGVCDNFPILTKEKGYTVVALRQWITRGEIAQGLVSNVKNWLKDGAFLLEYRNIQADHLNKPISFGAIGSENDLPHILTYQTSKSYNGVSITTGNFEGTDVLHVGKLAPTNVGTCINAAIWELVFLDHDATEEELTKIKDYFVKTYPWLFPDQAWTVVGKTNEDTDRATIANITGNGNNLVLSNFGFAGNSGYGDYIQNFSFFRSVNLTIWSIENTYKQVKFTCLNDSVNNTSLAYWGSNEKSSYSNKKWRLYLEVSNPDIEVNFKFNGPNWEVIKSIVLKPGINEIPALSPSEFDSLGKMLSLSISKNAVLGDWVLIQQIPDYEGYLVTDGVDDSGRAVNVTTEKDFTLVGEWKLFSDTSNNAGLSIHPQIHIFNRPESIQITFRSAGKTLPVKSLKAICSDGRCYDKDWNELHINVGNFTNNTRTLFVGSNGSNYTKTAFKNLSLYNNQIFSKEDCIKAYNYLQTLKS